MHIKELLAEASYGSLIDNEKYNDMDEADQQLYKYTADGFTYIGHHYNKLAKRYPFSGGVLYRGLHFDEQEQFDKFMSSIHDGEITTDGTSSWTPSKTTARDFSTTKKSYFPTLELMQSNRKMTDAGDHMTGYGGVVLQVEVHAGVGIDVNKTDYAKESEVILPSGTYKVTIVERNHPFTISHSTLDKANEMLAALKAATGKAKEDVDRSALNKYANYLMNSWLNKLEPEQVDILAKYWMPKDIALGHEEPAVVADKCITYEFDEDPFTAYKFRKTGVKHHRLDLRVYTPIDHTLYSRCSPTFQKRCDKYIKAIAQRLGQILIEIPKHPHFASLYDAHIDGIEQLRQFSQAGSILDKAAKGVRAALGNRYHELNSRETNRSLKTMDDIKDHGEKITKLLNLMAKL